MPDRIKVLQIIKTLNIGGAERFGIELTKALSKTIFNVKVVVFFRDASEIEKYWVSQLSDLNIEVVFLTQWKGNDRPLSYLNGTSRLVKLLRIEHPEILHSHFQLGTLAAMYCKLIGLTKKVIRTAHNHPRKEWGTGIYGDLRYQLISKWLYPLFVDSEAAVSTVIADELNKHPGATLFRRKARTIYNAVSDDILSVNAKKPGPREKPFVIIGSIGRLSEQKGYRYLLQAFYSVLNACPDAQLWLVGDGEEKPFLQDLAINLDITNHVHFLGKLSNVNEVLQEFDLFVLPSIWEGLPTVLLESAANSIPVIATNIPGTNEIIQDGISGWLVPPANPDGLAVALLDAINKPEERMRRATNARKGLDRFLMSNIAQQYAALYQELLWK